MSDEMTVAQAYNELKPIMKQSFAIDVMVWCFKGAGDWQEVQVTCRIWCAEHHEHHGGDKHPTLQAAVKATREAHKPVVAPLNEDLFFLDDLETLMPVSGQAYQDVEQDGVPGPCKHETSMRVPIVGTPLKKEQCVRCGETLDSFEEAAEAIP